MILDYNKIQALMMEEVAQLQDVVHVGGNRGTEAGA